MMKRNWILNAFYIGLLGAVVCSAQWVAPDAAGDQAVGDAVEDQYETDGVVDVNAVDVSVTDGIVNLTGEVDNILEKDRATYIAEQVKGVRSVSNRLVVNPRESRTDAELHTAITDALFNDPVTENYEIEVQVDDGNVNLRGDVESGAERIFAERVVKGVRGVVGVENEIEVNARVARLDSEIKPEIEKRLRWDVLVDDGLIDVDVNNGVVTLSGVVGSAAEKRRAETDCWVAAVDAVVSDGLIVDWTRAEVDLRDNKYTPKSDEEIQQAIKDSSLYDPRLLSVNLTPEVDSGWVTLRGNVNSLQAKQAAEQLAQNTVGVIGVTNRLKVRPAGEVADGQIDEDVDRALKNNPYTDSYEIQATTYDGRVTLAGSVDTSFEKAQAERVASGIRGVTDVLNLLDVAGNVAITSYLTSPFSIVDPVYGYTTALPSVSMSDKQIHDDIKNELWWSPFVDADQVNVEVNYGVATLTGEVDTWGEYRAAAENAREGGALRVVNELEVN